MTRREKAAVILTFGLLLIFGAVGNCEFYGTISAFDVAEMIIGMVLLIISIPLSGDPDIDKEDKDEE